MKEADVRKAKIGDRVMFKPLSPDKGEYCEGTITDKRGREIMIKWDDGQTVTMTARTYTRVFLSNK